jgi:hypothetical protein
MKSTILIASASVLALGLGACAQKPVARATLDCPTSQGDLTLKSKAADGKTCVYTAGESEMTLQMVAGAAETTLDRLETELLAGRASAKSESTDESASDAAEASATAASDAASADISAAKAGARADIAAAKAEAKAAKAEARAAKAGADVDNKVTVHVGGDGDSVEVNEEDGTARVNLPGIHIEANDKDDSARVQIGPIKINANGDEATVRIRKDQRLKGEQFSAQKRGVRATFISKVKNAADGYRYVGYEAAGPKVGPLTIGVIKAKSGDGGEDLHDDVVKLVRRNGGV